MKSQRFAWFVSLMAAFGLLACGTSKDPIDPGTDLRSEKQRIVAPDTSPENLETLVDGNSRFALDMYALLAEGDENVFFSPYSISVALAMTWGGARNDTEAEIAGALHFNLPQADLHPALNYVDLELSSRGEGAEGADEEPFRLNVVNSIWGQVGHPFLDDFLDVLAVNYGAGLRLMDFTYDPDACGEVINDWVEEKTEDRIQDLIPPGTLSDMTRLVLVNAIYFNAAWNTPFEEEYTLDAAFTTLAGAEVQVPTMHQDSDFPYTTDEEVQVVELPYDGEELSMVIMLPAQGQFSAFESSMSLERINGLLDDLQPALVNLSLPRWTFTTPSMKLAQILSDLGMPGAFAGDADFSGMDGQIFLYIGEVIHKAFIAVNEAGTEAAAATAVVMCGNAAPPEPVTFTADRPFIYMIRDIPTGSILFMGRVTDPS
ncbi:MAG: serpin family protein [Deltaproteobacteria bacterium]|nr:serpin family protein [Deltaproteobacteria bacterium]